VFVKVTPPVGAKVKTPDATPPGATKDFEAVIKEMQRHRRHDFFGPRLIC
jgi:hypothetical protein